MVVALLLVAFYLWPLDPVSSPETVFKLVVYLLALVALAVVALRSTMRAQHPRLRAVTSLAIIIPLYLILFAAGYYALALGQPQSFSQVIDRTDALYFTVTVFSAVGFGDIAPVTQLARIVTMLQMVANLLVLGVLLNAFARAVRHRHGARTFDKPANTDDPFV